MTQPPPLLLPPPLCVSFPFYFWVCNRNKLAFLRKRNISVREYGNEDNLFDCSIGLLLPVSLETKGKFRPAPKNFLLSAPPPKDVRDAFASPRVPLYAPVHQISEQHFVKIGLRAHNH